MANEMIHECPVCRRKGEEDVDTNVIRQTDAAGNKRYLGSCTNCHNVYLFKIEYKVKE